MTEAPTPGALPLPVPRTRAAKVFTVLQALVVLPMLLLDFLPGHGWLPEVVLAFAVTSLVAMIAAGSAARIVLLSIVAFVVGLFAAPEASGLNLMSPWGISPLLLFAWSSVALVAGLLWRTPVRRPRLAILVVGSVAVPCLLPVVFSRLWPAFATPLWWLPSLLSLVTAPVVLLTMRTMARRIA